MGSLIKTADVSQLMPGKTSWTVEVKVLHKWISFSHQTGASIEMVLSDKNGVKIHASCNQSLMPHLERYLTVGDWKVITNFHLSNSNGLHRITDHVYKMDFVVETHISESNVQSNDMFLNLEHFANVLNGSHDQSFLIDVLGAVLDLGGRDLVQGARKEVSKLEFTLRDTNDLRLRCCITGRLGQKLADDDRQLIIGDICLIRFAKVSNYKGELLISNAGQSSFVLINPDVKEADALKQMYQHGNNKRHVHQPKRLDEVLSCKRHNWSQLPCITIQAMKRMTKGEKCRVICHVYAIDTTRGWYYFACVVCNKKVFKARVTFTELDYPYWWCESCQCNVKKVSPRYMLNLLVQDLTGESRFSLVDSAAALIVKHSAANVLNTLPDQTMLDNQDILPPLLVDVVGKTYGFGISFDENNIFPVGEYKAMKVWNLDDIIKKNVEAIQLRNPSPRKKPCLSHY